MTRRILLSLVILLLACGPAWAGLLISTPGAPPITDHTPYGTTTDRVVLQNVTYNTDSFMSYSDSGYGYSRTSSANPLAFQVKSNIQASLGQNWASVDGVATWFVVNGGTPGSTVNLIVDIGFQGQISASSTASGASFLNYLSFVSSTSSTVYEYLILQNGTVSPGPTGFTMAGTVDDFVHHVPGTYNIDEVIRSLPFEVTVGTPFRLALVLNATVATNGATADTAQVVWDPGVSTLYSDGFAIVEGEDYIPLAELGYTIDTVNIPIPPTFLLLGSGLLSLGAIGWRRKRKS